MGLHRRLIVESRQIKNFVSQAFGVRTTHDNAEVVKNCEVLVIGVKPPVVPKVLTEVAFLVEPVQHLVISIALGIPIRYLEQVRFSFGIT